MKGLLRPDVKWLKFTVFIFGMMIHSTGDTVITNLIGITITIQSGTTSPSYLLLGLVRVVARGLAQTQASAIIDNSKQCFSL